MNVFIKREYDYAVRTCAYLAGIYPDQFIAIKDLSLKIHVPKPTLNKIIHYLKKAGIVQTVQGKMGGVHLLMDPNQLSILQILEAMGFDSTLNDCVHHPEICPLVNICKIHEFFVEQEMKFLQLLREKKITEFIFQDKDLHFSDSVSRSLRLSKEEE
ncbi:MAG: hypothetical protein Kow00108_08170 [Calditrichia bacterium]